MNLSETSNLTVSVPWPVRLFGEGTECFGLPTVSVALNLRTAIRVSKRNDRNCIIHGHRIDTPINFTCDFKHLCRPETRTLTLAVKALHENNISFDNGYDFEIFTLVPETEDILNSPAMLVAWVTTLLTLTERVKHKSGNEIAKIACNSLGKETKTARAINDIHTCVLGGTLFLRNAKQAEIDQIERALSGLVYAYPKPPASSPLQVSDLHERTDLAIAAAVASHPAFSLVKTSLDDMLPMLDAPELKEHAGVIYAHLSNRDDCVTARDLLEREFGLDDDRIGELIDRTHEMFRDYFGYASPEIESLITSAIEAGALGTKANVHSNSLLSFAAGRQDDVIAAIRGANGVALPVEISEGISVNK